MMDFKSELRWPLVHKSSLPGVRRADRTYIGWYRSGGIDDAAGFVCTEGAPNDALLLLLAARL